MKKLLPEKIVEADFQNILIRSVTYLMALASAFRGLQVYPEVSKQLLYVLVPYCILLALEGLIKNRHKILDALYVLMQLGMVILLYSIAPLADYWALLMLPACIFVMQQFNRWQGYGFILLFCTGTGIMLSRAEGQFAVEYIPIYTIAFILISSNSLVIQQITESRNNAEKLSRKLENANLQLRIYADRAADIAAAEERTALAEELHDSVTQTMFSLNLLLNSLENNYELQPDELKADILKISGLSESAMKEFRIMINQLRPENRKTMDFYSELNRIVEELKANHKFTVEVEHQGQLVPVYARKAVLRIIREALFNSLKHSGENKSKLNIRATDSNLVFIVSDNGFGINSDNPVSPGHIGIESMKLRSLELGARFNIESLKDQGTTIILTLPLRAKTVYEE